MSVIPETILVTHHTPVNSATVIIMSLHPDALFIELFSRKWGFHAKIFFLINKEELILTVWRESETTQQGPWCSEEPHTGLGMEVLESYDSVYDLYIILVSELVVIYSTSCICHSYTSHAPIWEWLRKIPKAL